MLLLLAGALLVVSCDDSDGTDAGGEPVETSQIAVVDNEFQPETVQIASGDTINWTWEGAAPHDVEGDGFKSELQTEGTFAHTFETAGEYQYICTIHSGMTGTVVVADQ